VRNEPGEGEFRSALKKVQRTTFGILTRRVSADRPPLRMILSTMVFCLVRSGWGDPQIGKTWDPFHMTDVVGNPVAWVPGRVTVLSFCAYWCDTWRQQVPRSLAAKRATSGLPVDFVTISVDGRWSEVADGNGGLPLWLDKGGDFSKSKSVDRVPTTVVLDSSGEVRFVSGSVLRTEDIIQAVHESLATKPVAGTVYLTFDDFPPKQGGEEFLDLLRALGVKATLFCMGSRVESEAKLLKRALREGHSLQCHSWDHDASSPQLDRCKSVFERVLGIQPTLYRPPGSEQILGEETHHRIINPYDFSRPTKQELIRRILPQVCPEAVIQLHDGVAVTQEALSEIVADLQKRGFSLATLGGWTSVRTGVPGFNPKGH